MGAPHSDGGRTGLAAWWHRAARRPGVLWAVVVLNAFVGLEAAAALLYWELRTPRSVSVGANVGTPLQVPPVSQPPAGPQPAPVAVDIASIGVHTDLVTLDVDPTGMLEAPADFEKAGWWAAGPAPGADGAAVLVGHLDSHRGPAAFFRVPSLKPGDGIEVRRADGSTAAFVVDAVRQYSKDSLPARQIYGPTPGPELRLITCGGRFDRRTRSYDDNIVVFAHRRTDSGEAPAA
jgi:sortase (surface protein transpeptidase)